MMEETTPTPENWMEHAGIENPESPTPQQIAEAWRTLADYNTLFALIKDMNEAIRCLEYDPKAKELVKRYKPVIHVLVSDAELLMQKMKDDYEKGQKFEEK